MHAYLRLWLALKTDRRAVTALEYGLIAALIGGVIIAGATTLGTDINALFVKIGGQITAAGAKS